MTEGEPLIVAAVLQSSDTWRFGALRIAMREEQPFLWLPRRGGGETAIPPPIEVIREREADREEQKHMKALHFKVFEFNAAGRAWRVAVPRIDIPLVRRAFENAENR